MVEILKPDAYDLSLLDKDAKLDTGMSAREAIMHATNWWNNKGRHIMRQHNLRQSEPVGGSNNGAGASFATLNPDSPNFLPSKILAGKPWDDLNRDERARVVKVWHHQFVRVPQKPVELG